MHLQTESGFPVSIAKSNPVISLSPHEQDLVRIANFRLMDDDFMSEILDNDIEAVTLILRILLQREDLMITSVKTQYEYHSAGKRSIRLDIRALDTAGIIYDIELQRSNEGAAPKRLRYHSSRIDADLLHKGDPFEKLAETYVIFICENDIFHRGYPLYHINRHIEELNNAPFDDGSHIIYVNGQYRDLNDPIGQLMNDFHCSHSKDMILPILADRIYAFKETDKGVEHMCEMLEEMRREVAERTAEAERISIARSLLAENVPIEIIARGTGLSLETIEELRKEILIHA